MYKTNSNHTPGRKGGIVRLILLGIIAVIGILAGHASARAMIKKKPALGK